ncbi:MAG: hypothetical protein LCH95_24120 [Proteobacteria bacterium]|nr:hypothetical protein [Pseudomonadota bacterium]
MTAVGLAPRPQRYVAPMTSLDRHAAFALRGVRGLSANAQRIADTLVAAARAPTPITVRQRHALYAICWRFRRQLPTSLMVKVTLALAEAKAAAEEARLENPLPSTIRADRSPGARRLNPLDGLFADADLLARAGLPADTIVHTLEIASPGSVDAASASEASYINKIVITLNPDEPVVVGSAPVGAASPAFGPCRVTGSGGGGASSADAVHERAAPDPEASDLA